MNELRFLYVSSAVLAIVIIIHVSYYSESVPFGYASERDTDSVPKIISLENGKIQNGVLKEKIMSINDSNDRIVISGDNKRPEGSESLPNLNDSEKSCKKNFKCVITNDTGWADESSLRISTVNNTKNQWSSIFGQEVHVSADERYEILSHVKLDKRARNSNLLLEGFNETSKNWQEISKCPYDIKGPVQWTEFRCSVTIEHDITKIRPVFNAGWSSSKNKEAVTWFDHINLTKFSSFIADPKLKFEIVYEGLKYPTSMAFLGPDDFIVLEREGTVQRIVDGIKSNTPLIDLDVADYEDGGLLGIAVKNEDTNGPNSHVKPVYVYLYFTSQKVRNENNVQQKDWAANVVYRYELMNNTLKNGKLLLNLPAGYHHDGGPILIGPDNKTVYISVGDVENEYYKVVANKALNNKSGADPDGTGGILRFGLDGQPINEGILGKKYPLNLYYAYGIRNSFGMAFDPLTGKLWTTDNSHETGDEINKLEPGFNGGWNKVQGIWPYAGDFVPNASHAIYDPTDLVTFEGKGKYRSPEFIWNRTVGPTALLFMTTDKLGKQYKNDMFVADVENGRIYHFELNRNRTGLLLDGPLSDKIADTDKELKRVVFAGNFGLITDMDVGPDGYLYFVVFNEGKIYRIVPVEQN
jgi:glucose/arabinose dehydrogenase